MIPFQCVCRAPLSVGDELAGRPVRCPFCHAAVRAPAVPAVQAAPTAGSFTPPAPPAMPVSPAFGMQKPCLRCGASMPAQAIGCALCGCRFAPPPEAQEIVRNEIARLRQWALWTGIPGLAIQLVCQGYQFVRVSEVMAKVFPQRPGGGPPPMPDIAGLMGALMPSMLGGLLGTVLLVVGLCFWSRMKGRSAGWGALGLLGWLVGPVVVAVLPKICRNCRRDARLSANECEYCASPV